MLNYIQHDVMKTKGQQCSTTVILNLFQDLPAERDSKGRGKMLKFAIEREQEQEKMEFISGIKMSKFANSKFFLCHVAGIFPSRGRTFSLARQ
jgi:hypothetical protein